MAVRVPFSPTSTPAKQTLCCEVTLDGTLDMLSRFSIKFSPRGISHYRLMSELLWDADIQPSLVIIYFGGNDSMGPHTSGQGPHVPLPEYKENMRKIAVHLKVETLENLLEWKATVEEALANVPNTTLVMGQNGLFRNEQGNAADTSSEQANDRQPIKSLVIGRPILLALKDIDGTLSFLEKALKFVEEHGVKVEGILRQAIDVEDVERRIREYEQGLYIGCNISFDYFVC